MTSSHTGEGVLSPEPEAIAAAGVRSAAHANALTAEALRQVARAANHKRETDGEYEQAIKRSGRPGLSHCEIAAAAEVSRGTVRAILARATASEDRADPPLLTADTRGVDGGPTWRRASSHPLGCGSRARARLSRRKAGRARARGITSRRSSSQPVRS